MGLYILENKGPKTWVLMIVLDWNLARSLGKTYGVWKCKKKKKNGFRECDHSGTEIVQIFCTNDKETIIFEWNFMIEYFIFTLHVHVHIVKSTISTWLYKAHGPSRRVFI